MEQQDEHEPAQDEEARFADRQGQSSTSCLIFLGVLIAIILLSISLYLPLSDFGKFLVLTAVIAGGGIGLLLLQKEQVTTPDQQASQQQEPAEEPGVVSFEQLVQEALNAIPAEFHEQMEKLIVIVENEPDEETLRQVGVAEGRTLLGLYHGVPLTTWGYNQVMLPERITIYQDTIERYCGGDPERIRAQVRATVLHEVAHHFGMGHEEMPIWIK